MIVATRRYSVQALAVLCLLTIISWANPSAAQTIVFVDASATPSGCSGATAVSDLDGSSWDCAYPALQDALDDAEFGSGAFEIRVATGVYYPDIDNVDSDGSGGPEHIADDPAETFLVDRDGISILGGYPSGGGIRDSDLNPTVLSGDIQQDDQNRTSTGVTPTVDNISGSNAFHVVTADATGENLTNTIIDGVTITAGNANNFYPENTGGGIRCDATNSSFECSPSLSSLRLQGNFAEFGGGIYFDGSNGTGAGTFRPQLSDISFQENRSAVLGGAIGFATEDGGVGEASLTNVVFVRNSTEGRGGAIAVFARRSSGSTVSITITNSVFVDNVSTNDGGAIFSDADASGNESSVDLINVTFSKNAASTFSSPANGGAIYSLGRNGGNATVNSQNSIFWDNDLINPESRSCPNFGTQIFADQSGSNLTVSHSVLDGGAVQDGTGGISVCDGATLNYDAASNIEVDPQFVDEGNPAGSDGVFSTSDDGLQLRGVGFATPSPTIDAGNNSAVPTGITTDLLGNDRFYEGDGQDLPTVDMGAYEYVGQPLPVELAGFSAQLTNGGTVVLQWQTLSETNNSRFNLQRRETTQQAWRTIGTVEGAGTTNDPQQYRFTDRDLPYTASSMTYRLKQIDVDGGEDILSTVEVTLDAPQQVELLGTNPNPARARATARLAVPRSADAESVRLRLYDILGRQVRSFDSQVQTGQRQDVSLDLSGLASGTYLLRLSAGGSSQTQRVTVVR